MNMKLPNDSIAYAKPSVNSGIQLGIISVTLIIAICTLVWNTSGLNAVLERSTAAYVQDVSYQLTNDIAARFESLESTLKQLSDSISNQPDDFTTTEYLERKLKLTGFEELVIIDRDGNVTPQGFNIANMKNLSGVQDSFSGKSSVIYVEGQNLLFSTPIYRNHHVEKVLVGVRKKEKMQELIQPESFDGNGLTCIVDSEGQVVISPTDLKPFLQLDSIFKAGGDTKAAQAVRKMQEDLRQQQSGEFQFTAVDETRLVMSYHALGVNDWILLTLVPADLISGEANLYIFRAFLIVAGVSLLFALFLAYSVRFYRKSRKQLERIAFTDPLTGGMNNAAFQLEYQTLAETMRPGTYAVIMLNVKGFKFINENFGIATGNDILKHICEVLTRHVGEGEFFARGEADHFFLCLKENDKKKIQLRLDDIIAKIDSFSFESDICYTITILQGAYLIDEPKLHIGIIQDRARVVCQDTKCLFYSSEIAQKTKKEHELNALFEDSLENHDFHVVLQPKVRLADGSIHREE